MTFWEPSWLGPVLAENFALFQGLDITNSNFYHTGFTPTGRYAAGHMLEVIVIEKDTLSTILFLSKFIAYLIDLFQLALIYRDIILSFLREIIPC